jgi:colanic acid biosynthesis glycosyl transferase WcaI
VKKRILLIGYNFHPEPTGIGKYNGEMMQWLTRNGYDCSVLTAYPYYPYWEVQPPYVQDRLWYKKETLAVTPNLNLDIYRVPIYVPKSPTGLKRILLDVSFSITAFLKLLQLFSGKKFNCVIVVAPSFQFGILGVLCKKIWKSKFIYHIQDLQIEAARDLKMIKSRKIIDIFFKIENYIFSQANVITSISEGMIDRISQKAQKEVILFPNWADVQLIYPLSNKNALKRKFGFNDTDKIALYSGAIGEKQGIEAILYAAQEFIEEPDVKFLICGSGPYEKTLRSLANKLNLQNVVFLPLQPLEKFNALLNIADIHLVIQKSNASDLVMPSKLTNILSVGGLALITANPESSLYKLVAKHKIGLLIPAENQLALNMELRKAFFADTSIITKNARAYAEYYLAVDNVMQNFVKTVLD